MRQTVENVSPLTLKLAFRVRNERCEDFALILKWIILRLVLLDRAAFPALDASTKERESSSVAIRTIGKCALLGVACMLFRARRKSKREQSRLGGADRFPCEQTDLTGTRLSNLQIRVVNAFRQGLDTRYGEHSSTTLAEVLRKQSSLSKRLSQTSSIEYADNIPDELTIPEIDVERLSSHSHTETAV
ncbi:hypothetical protein ALC62_05532 [Cyphomyrmex costatus]|uniref:Uncharacterized protein n=1 Tax=Cyphomyrmex costatus TaxID=456900 RepID=A0A195CSJ1_9HYME|nr:hypothetical protein ALC62_05532 [Cyphomyrmex costatus]